MVRHRVGHVLRILLCLVGCSFALSSLPTSSAQQSGDLKLVPNRVTLSSGKKFALNLPAAYEISVAAEGLKRVRFLAKAPDGRLFVTGMFSLADNQRGAIYILDGFDAKTGKFAKVLPYLQNLRNPNSIAFYKDAKGQDWLYVALTDKLERFKFRTGEEKPSSEPEVLGTYPDYGLNYKYGGWHLTRTIAFGEKENKDKLYISVGSSCNACEEKEEIRATVSVMDADGRNPRIIASGLRNAVGLKIAGGKLYATNMGADHLGDDAPDDTMFALDDEAAASREMKNYGWPYCYFANGKILDDPKFTSSAKKADCAKVPPAFTTFAAHGSPLGLEFFDAASTDPLLRDHFLVALHGSGRKRLKRGYKVVRVGKDGNQDDFITGFLQNGTIYGRPCDIFRVGADSFLLTDDYSGVIYFIRHE
jgi:glucose/arabinose dehydrogenase